jgi:WD40 repeat protein
VGVSGAVFTRDSAFVLVCYRASDLLGRKPQGNRAVLFAVDTGKKVWETAIPNGATPIGFLADDRSFVLRAASILEVRDKDGKLVRDFAPPMDVIREGKAYWASVSLSADAKSIFIINVDGLKQWDPTSREVIRDFGQDFKTVLRMSRLGQTVDKDDHSAVSIADLESLEPMRPGEAPYTCSALSADGRFIAKSGKKDEVVIWNTRDKEVTQRLAGHAYAVGFSNDGKQLVSAKEDELALWDVNKGMKTWHSKAELWHGECFSMSLDGNYALTVGHPVQIHRGLSVDLKVWDLRKRKVHRVLSDDPRGSRD